MEPQNIDYERVIEDLEQKRRQINGQFDAAIAAIRRVLILQDTDGQALLPGVQMPSSTGVGGPPKPYVGMSMLQAAIKHIQIVGHAVPNLLLAKALEDGGYEHKSKNFPNTLNSVLWRRAKSAGDVRKSGKGWEVVRPF